MRHQHPTDEVLELAAQYALGALPPVEADSFEAHLAEGCGVCAEEVEAFAAVAGRLGYAATAERPRPEVRARLLARMRGETGTEAAQPVWTIVRASEGTWEGAGMEGVTLRRLFRDQATGRYSVLGRLAAGASYPSHRHADTEELFVLDGDLVVEGQVLRAGDYCAAMPGTVHDRSYSAGGCTFFLSASERDDVVGVSRWGGPQAGLVIVRSAEIAWREGPAEGVSIRPFFRDSAWGMMTGLVRMRPGARLRGDGHGTGGQVYLLEGGVRIARETLRTGDFFGGLAGSMPDIVTDHEGCVFLLASARTEDFGIVTA